jgi:hypothetical protein
LSRRAIEEEHHRDAYLAKYQHYEFASAAMRGVTSALIGEWGPVSPTSEVSPAGNGLRMGTSKFDCRYIVSFHREKKPMKKLATLVMLVAFSAPALAADEFYVVQDVKTKKCTIVDKKPTTTTETTIVGDGKVYKTRTEAETGMKSVKVCTTN